MKRNWDTIRIILEKVEAGELPVYLEKEKYLDSGMSEDDVLVYLLFEQADKRRMHVKIQSRASSGSL